MNDYPAPLDTGPPASEPAADTEDSYPGAEWRSERVHELLENLEELKKQNSNLQKRVRYLEDKNAVLDQPNHRKPKPGKSSDPDDGSKAKVSKWTKMKGALGWEMKADVSQEIHPEEMDSLKVPALSSSDHSSSISASPQGSSFVSGESLNERQPHGSTSSSEEDLLAAELAERTAEGRISDHFLILVNHGGIPN
ncbi:hypothetical protein AAG570_002488 [Ranatra chinensis]|uniref:Uncharacterized protein n=1 Tax=Ranatra chinensis TaxID=642074 RepID=A0ABD0Y7P6_9HEMI